MNYEEIIDKLYKTYQAKNTAYGDSFNISLDEEGLAAARIRLGDKYRRFATLSKNPDIPTGDESIQDTLMDMANYAIMTVMWMTQGVTKR